MIEKSSKSEFKMFLFYIYTSYKNQLQRYFITNNSKYLKNKKLESKIIFLL